MLFSQTADLWSYHSLPDIAHLPAVNLMRGTRVIVLVLLQLAIFFNKVPFVLLLDYINWIMVKK
jgi:hypothetical protein